MSNYVTKEEFEDIIDMCNDFNDDITYLYDNKQNAISDLETIRSGASKGATAVQPSSLAKVATSGSYNDLSNKPTIPNYDSILDMGFLTEENVAVVAISGSYNNLSDTPDIPTEATVSGWGFTKNAGTITAIQANGTSIATSGVANIPAASTSKYGVTKLSSSTSSTSTSLAATASAVKSAYDLANGKQEALVSGTNIKTINNNSILGSGNLTINPLLSISSDTSNISKTISISPNVFYILTAVQTTQKTFDILNTGVVSNSDNVWGIRFQIGTTVPTINFSSTNYRIIWANGTAPTFEAGVLYEITFKALGTSLLAVCGAFKTV